MSTGSEENSLWRERLSALADGELEATDCAAVCTAWRQGDVRRTWHAYHLIGDVLRSDDLARSAGSDAAFLVAIRQRLAVEPVVLAPAPRPARAGLVGPAAGRHRSAWMLSSAVAAGFLLVVGAFVLGRPGPEPTAATPIASATVAAPPAPIVQAALPDPDAQAMPVEVIANGKMIRDARLDRYLAAHKQFAGSSALGVPSAFLRSATVESGRR